MKDGVYFVNMVRGVVVDEVVFIVVLELGKVVWVGLDVFVNELSLDFYFLKSEKVVIQLYFGGLMDVVFQWVEKECFENMWVMFIMGKFNFFVNQLKQIVVLQEFMYIWFLFLLFIYR